MEWSVGLLAYLLWQDSVAVCVGLPASVRVSSLLTVFQIIVRFFNPRMMLWASLTSPLGDRSSLALPSVPTFPTSNDSRLWSSRRSATPLSRERWPPLRGSPSNWRIVFVVIALPNKLKGFLILCVVDINASKTDWIHDDLKKCVTSVTSAAGLQASALTQVKPRQQSCLLWPADRLTDRRFDAAGQLATGWARRPGGPSDESPSP